MNSCEQDVFGLLRPVNNGTKCPSCRVILDRRIQNGKPDLEKKQKENERKRRREGKVSRVQDTDLWGSCCTKDREILLSK